MTVLDWPISKIREATRKISAIARIIIFVQTNLRCLQHINPTFETCMYLEIESKDEVHTMA